LIDFLKQPSKQIIHNASECS